MNLDGVRLVFSDLDDTLAELYKPVSGGVQEYLDQLLNKGVIVAIITGQGKEGIYDRVASFIDEKNRKNLLMCGCSGAYVYGFDENGQINENPFYSIYDEKMNEAEKRKFREVIAQLVDEFQLVTYPKMPREEFRILTHGQSTSIMLDDRMSQITFEVINDLELRERILKRGKELFRENDLLIETVKAGTFAIDFTVEGVSKTVAVRFIMEHVLAQMNCRDIRDKEIQIWGDKYSLVNGGTDMNILYGLNRQVLAIDFRDEPDDELDLSYNIQKWRGQYSLSKGLEEYLGTTLGSTNAHR